ncbi:hypothetical protein [Streptosporangium longisporum]|uniref:Uncharacterized protein n=1 Tax=Streptosporangium longisporum TaxID=46187 RepID=A0ABN3XU57_9ACTN
MTENGTPRAARPALTALAARTALTGPGAVTGRARPGPDTRSGTGTGGTG